MDRSQCDNQIGYLFKLKSRCLCNFLERHLWNAQIKVPGFSRICINVAERSDPEFFINSCNAACVNLPLDGFGYRKLNDIELQEFYIELLLRGVRKFMGAFPAVLTTLDEGIDLFRAAGYKNEWIERSRRFNAIQLSAKLLCSLTIRRFALRLQVLRKNQVIYDKVILKTDPDEIAFAYRFDDVIAENGEIIVTSKHQKPLAKVLISTLELEI